MFFEFVRNLILPLNTLETYIPKTGKVLDVGCGHGILCKLLAKTADSRTILGIDPSKEKIRLAKKDLFKYKNLKFKQSYIADIKERGFDCIIVIDVMYLLPPDEKTKFLKEIKKRLKENGTLILKEVERNNSYTDLLIKAEEMIMVKILRKTYSDFKDIYLMTKRESVILLKNLNFKIIKSFYIKGFFPYPHLLIVAKLNQK